MNRRKMLQLRLIGSMLFDPFGTNWRIVGEIEPDDFREPLLRAIWLNIVHAFAESRSATVDSVHALMLGNGTGVDHGGTTSSFALLVNLHGRAVSDYHLARIWADALIRARKEIA